MSEGYDLGREAARFGFVADFVSDSEYESMTPDEREREWEEYMRGYVSVADSEVTRLGRWRTELRAESDDPAQDPELPTSSWPGAYPLIYITHNGDELCAACASDRKNKAEDYDIVEETDNDIYCDLCDRLIAEQNIDENGDVI